MAEFIIATVFILLFLAKKIFFFGIEDQFSSSLIGKLDIVSLFAIFILGIMGFIKKTKAVFKIRLSSLKDKRIVLSVLLLIITAVLVGTTFYVNFNKISLHWDAIALYEARAKFLNAGMKFSEMVSLGRYDNLNKYYYLLYPPFTSIGHYFWGKIDFLSRFPVGVYYSVFLAALVGASFFVAKRMLGLLAASFLALLIASNGSIINIAIKEYTNLPFAFYIVFGIFLLLLYIRKGEKWTFLFGTILVAASIWIRLLEPVWIAVCLAFGIATIEKKRLLKQLLPFGVLSFMCFLQYASWTYFTKGIAENPGFLNFSALRLIEPFVAAFTGAPFIVVTTVASKWGIIFMVHILALLSVGLKWEEALKKREILFLGMVLLLSLVMYFLEFYFLSFQYDWWSTIARSLERSATFLIPISAYLLIWAVSTSKVFSSGVSRQKSSR